ncbi:tetratricopeptide repeat protein [Maribellus sp. YY47]|uniref:tetratricopeptide repeat protein n=1 Tax=Maribellus sp. YY47 TaxID=2929486 RepID=UPI002001927C|nr:tetratricopeptide repeat protein [Maribellus sp. YY47]MCK3682511.1 tetratricopeptide repeat protein [Maribellus sp. YY47]
MKALLRITLFFVVTVLTGITVAQAQRVLKGTVYMDGKPAAGITVEAQKGGTMMTSFDGKYEVEADAKTKWIKFTFIDEKKTLDIEGKTGDVFDFAFTGEIPSGNAEEDNTGGEVNLGTAEDLIKAGNETFRTEYSLYSEFYKQKDYKSAKPHWQVLYNQFPKSSENIYIQGAKMYEDFIEKAATKEEKDKLINEYMKLYDKRIKYYGEEGYVLGRKGTAWLKYKLNTEGAEAPEGDALVQIYKSGYEWLNKSISLQGNKTEAPVLILYMQTTVALFKLGELPQEQVVKNYENTVKVSNEIIAANENADNVKTVKETVLPFTDDIFGKSGAADCDVLEKIYSSEFAANKDDIDYIKTMLRRLGKANCTESDLFAQATERLYELDPSAEAAFNMARRLIKKGDVAKAKEYYKMAMEQETDQELLASYYLQYGLVLYSESSYSEARSYARKVLDIQPNNCDANMLIGNIYVAASRSFDGKNIEKAAIFWVACDYFEKARRSEDCSIDAAQKISEYRKYFPDKEEAFMEGLQAGSSFKVGGWINETTKVRF